MVQEPCRDQNLNFPYYIGNYYKGSWGDARSLDYGSCRDEMDLMAAIGRVQDYMACATCSLGGAFSS